MALGLRGAGAFLRMLSSASLLLALKSGCLNSHAYQSVSLAILFAAMEAKSDIPLRRRETRRPLHCYAGLCGSRTC